MALPEDKQTPFGVLTYEGVRAYRDDRGYWLGGPPSEGEQGWTGWTYFWWRTLPGDLDRYGINLGYEPASDRWLVVTGPFFGSPFYPIADGDAPGGFSEQAMSEAQAMVLIAEGLRRFRQHLVEPIDEMLVGVERPRKVGEPWFDRL